MKTKILSIAVIALLSLSLFSCNDNGSDGDGEFEQTKRELGSIYNELNFLFNAQEAMLAEVQKYSVGVISGTPSSDVSNIETPDPTTRTFTINFNDTGNTSEFGKEGKVYVRLTNIEPTGYFTNKEVSFDNDFRISSNGYFYKCNGGLRVTPEAKISENYCVEKIIASNFLISGNVNNQLAYSTSDYKIIRTNINTEDTSDDTYKLVGTAAGESSYFHSFSISINDTIKWKKGSYYTSGNSTYTAGSLTAPFYTTFGTPEKGMTINYYSKDYTYSFIN